MIRHLTTLRDSWLLCHLLPSLNFFTLTLDVLGRNHITSIPTVASFNYAVRLLRAAPVGEVHSGVSHRLDRSMQGADEVKL